jgi:hypothetical protein
MEHWMGSLDFRKMLQTYKLQALPVFFLFFFLLLFICAYKAWIISPPYPHPLPYHPLRPLLLNFALISNFVEERV